MELQPGLAEAFNNLGIVLKKLGRVDEALSSYRDAVRLRPDYVEARNNLGNALRSSISLKRRSRASGRSSGPGPSMPRPTTTSA